MAEFPTGATIIPNPVNRVVSFAIRDHYFFPGFPQMAWPMLDWVLSTRQPPLTGRPAGERAIVVYGAGESQLLPLMNACTKRYPRLKLYSLPTFLPDGGRRLELGVRGDPALLDAALADLVAGVEAGGFRWEPFAAAAASAPPSVSAP
jgi:molybdopterin-biosynthesis enzyme MoeA-like protein